ncbi:MAG: GTP-binding protein Era [uncultured Acidimicrobiales bacterium]|uniref:GTPase Era n=1 Tax=uncultured Acidimicrobiales bacterium TaxID=310071 RepID=A0A6J4HKB0_9ACTN|nr:MAG: GTP-binding protein Era [uncultured Acidimicrobiales bacterium]
MRSGFATLVGRPNVGKSTLLNKILHQKVSIVSDKPQTTRTQVRGVLTRDDVQVVFVDTPGIHKPKTLLGERLNDTAAQAVGDVDVVVLLIDATQPLGKGDRWVAKRTPPDALVAVNKTDKASQGQIIEQLIAASGLEKADYYPISAKTGDGVDVLVDAITARMPEGPLLYPADVVTDVPEAFWVAELVREQLLIAAREELPHSIAAQVTEWDWPRVRVEILVERDSQKGIVIGKGGSVLKEVGTAVRKQMPEGAFIELFVKVDKDWQRRAKALERLGY